MAYLVPCSANLTGAADRITTEAREKRTSAESSRKVIQISAFRVDAIFRQDCLREFFLISLQRSLHQRAWQNWDFDSVVVNEAAK
jgi:hypothetical protein